VDRSRTPHLHPHVVSSEVVQLLVVTARKKHSLWGPRKLLVVVRRQHPRVALPSASTVGAIFKKRGLVGKPRRVRRSDPYKDRLGPYDAPNRVWCADLKGSYPVSGERYNPLTVSDGFSRCLLTCKALRSTTCAPVMRSFEATFREFGVPDAIREFGLSDAIRTTTVRHFHRPFGSTPTWARHGADMADQ
jgi:putative transposase